MTVLKNTFISQLRVLTQMPEGAQSVIERRGTRVWTAVKRQQVIVAKCEQEFNAVKSSDVSTK